MSTEQWTVYDLTEHSEENVVVVGDDRGRIELALDEFMTKRTIHADGGTASEFETLSTPPKTSVSELDEFERVLEATSGECVVVVFNEADRQRFFGTLNVCKKHDLEAVVPTDHASKVLVEDSWNDWLAVDLSPISHHQRTIKRAFDVVFSMVGLVVLAPLIAVIALAIKLDSSGPAVYTQRRTGVLGTTFQFHKFRTMYVGSENVVPENDAENGQITRVGRLLRTTHMDEIPQLWSILRGEMSAVGPRAAWVQEEQLLEEVADQWQKRWFIKPGLTGLAQINGANSTTVEDKLRYDLEYLSRQSLLFDAWIVAVQLLEVLTGLIELFEHTVVNRIRQP